jgi:hypothetical protein
MNFKISKLFIEIPCMWVNNLKFFRRRKSFFSFEIIIRHSYSHATGRGFIVSKAFLEE